MARACAGVVCWHPKVVGPFIGFDGILYYWETEVGMPLTENGLLATIEISIKMYI